VFALLASLSDLSCIDVHDRGYLLYFSALTQPLPRKNDESQAPLLQTTVNLARWEVDKHKITPVDTGVIFLVRRVGLEPTMPIGPQIYSLME